MSELKPGDVFRLSDESGQVGTTLIATEEPKEINGVWGIVSRNHPDVELLCDSWSTEKLSGIKPEIINVVSNDFAHLHTKTNHVYR
jgi:hypothetical protein